MKTLQVHYLTNTDPTKFLFLLLGIALVIAILSIVGKFRGNTTTSKKRSSFFPADKKKSPGFWALHKLSYKYGFTSEELHFLSQTFASLGVSDPETSLASSIALDKLFSKKYELIEKEAGSEGLAEQQKALLFSIRQSVEASLNGRVSITDSRKIPSGYPASIKDANNAQYPTRLFKSATDQLLAETPHSSVGSLIKMPRGSRITISFYSKHRQGFLFETRVLGSGEHSGEPVIILEHSSSISPLPYRKHKRQTAHIQASFAAAQLVETKEGKKTRRRLEVISSFNSGIIIDISAGGCALKTIAPLRAGEYTKIEFSDNKDRGLVALGRIVRTNKTSAVGAIMHIQFIKLPMKTSNTIQSLVYGYADN